MKNFIKISLLFAISLSMNVLASTNSDGGLPSNYLQRFNRAIKIIKNDYVEPVSDEVLLKNSLKGTLDGLDPHSSYLDADDLRDLRNTTTGHLSGIGLEITMDDGLVKVITPLDDTPAQKAGIKPGDIIIRVNDTLIKGLTLREAARKMRGPQGTPVTLTIIHKDANKPTKLKLIRTDIKLQSVKSRLLEPNLGYLRISSFEETTHGDVVSAIKKLNLANKGPLKGLILDLRNNPGGLLESATAVADDFLDPRNTKSNDLVVYTKGRASDSQVKIIAKPGDLLFHAPIVVLINEGSASGAEIVAGALQDYKRALIVGTRSFGKGSVQTVIPLDKDTAIKLTTALYYTPSGRSIQASGIVPDVKVEDFKINQAEEDQLNGLYAKEADLKGHISNEQANGIKLNNTNPSFSPNKQLITTDYQLSVALYLLEGMTVLQPAKQQ